MQKRKILEYFLFVLTATEAFFFWRACDQAIRAYDSSVWWLPISIFTLFFAGFCLEAVLLKKKSILVLLAVVSLDLSFIFSFSFWHLVVSVLAMFFIAAAENRIKNDLFYAVKINIWKSLRTGSTLLVFAFSLTVASFYYSEARDFPPEKLVPRFGTGSITSQLVGKVMNFMFPKMQETNGDFTVDKMISEDEKIKSAVMSIADISAKSQMQQNTSDIDQAIINEKKQEIYQEMMRSITEGFHQQMGNFAGAELKGDEGTSDVFTELINRKINEVIVPKLSERNILPIVPVAIALLLFLTIFPIGSFLSPIWVGIVYLFFIILVKTKIINIVKIPAEVEIIE